MLLPRAIPLLIHAPTAPDFYQCDPAYGRNIKSLDCQFAVEYDWPSGETPVHYYFEDPSPSNAIKIPKVTSQGSCQVAIEPAGPRYGATQGFESFLKHRPDELRALAGYVIEKCAHEGQGIGGFVTLGMEDAERYVHSAMNEEWETKKDWSEGLSANGAFLTISINGEERTSFMPGDTDPWVPAYLSKYAARLAQPFSEKTAQFDAIAFIYRWFAERMGRGGTLRWTTMPPFSFILTQLENPNNAAIHPDVDPDIESRLMRYSGKTTYQCDSSLASGPDPVDCERLSWSGLKSPDSVETLQAGVPNFYSEGSCALGISSPVATTITWAHILAAFSTLNNLCVQNPIQAVKGGRAYYGQQAINSWINGRKSKRDSVGSVNGTDALPPGINATIFRHKESSSIPCEWTLAQEGKNVTNCD